MRSRTGRTPPSRPRTTPEDPLGERGDGRKGRHRRGVGEDVEQPRRPHHRDGKPPERHLDRHGPGALPRQLGQAELHHHRQGSPHGDRAQRHQGQPVAPRRRRRRRGRHGTVRRRRPRRPRPEVHRGAGLHRLLADRFRLHGRVRQQALRRRPRRSAGRGRGVPARADPCGGPVQPHRERSLRWVGLPAPAIPTARPSSRTRRTCWRLGESSGTVLDSSGSGPDRHRRGDRDPAPDRPGRGQLRRDVQRQQRCGRRATGMERPGPLHRRDLVPRRTRPGLQAHPGFGNTTSGLSALVTHLDAERRQDRLRHLRGRAADR